MDTAPEVVSAQAPASPAGLHLTALCVCGGGFPASPPCTPGRPKSSPPQDTSGGPQTVTGTRCGTSGSSHWGARAKGPS